MSMYLQQLNVRSLHASHEAGVAVRSVLLNLVLLLVLVIIPTLSGVTLIA